VEDLQKDFVPYNFALRMKALGFDEPCFGFHSPIHDLMICNTKSVNKVAGECLAPTFSQAFRWFREKYDLNPLVAFDKYICEIDDEELENPYFTYYYSINELWAEGKDYDKFTRGFINVASNRDMLSHEEAELACLEKLIEIVEQKEKI
jgi:hypothetical protein